MRAKRGGFKVDDVTSVTKEEENERQQKAKSDSGRRNDTCTGHEADSPGQPVKRARTDNASLSEASIDQIFSLEKHNGDTVTSYCRGIKAKVWPWKNHRRNFSKMWTKIPVLLKKCF